MEQQKREDAEVKEKMQRAKLEQLETQRPASVLIRNAFKSNGNNMKSRKQHHARHK